MALAEYAKERLGLPLLFPEQTTFKEFAVRTGRPRRGGDRGRARARASIRATPSSGTTRAWRTCCSSAVTEKRRPADIDRLADVLAEVAA